MRNITNRVVTFVITLLVVVVAAQAHGGKPHLLGTVVGLHEQHLVVKDQQDKEHTVLLTDSTKLEKAGKPATRADLVAGVRVSVHFADAEGKTARLIKISPAAPK
jgi:hypothetical protein